ncbi:hypothetical protein, partial [Paenibacillus cookii]|uniref:hypothetical protein n=1 Tax=Paenibacillus cookii TaxID=157839 RepID=UPI001BB3D394
CGRLHLKGAPFFVGDVLDKHHSTKELEPFSCFSDDVTFEIQDQYFSICFLIFILWIVSGVLNIVYWERRRFEKK